MKIFDSEEDHIGEVDVDCAYEEGQQTEYDFEQEVEFEGELERMPASAEVLIAISALPKSKKH